MSIDQYSSTPSNNDLSNYFKTGMRPSAVKSAGWDIMADVASYLVSLPAAGGTATALTASNGRPFGALVPGLLQILNPTSANTGPASFAPDGLTAEAIYANGAALAGGEMQPGVPVFLQYDGTQWNLLNPAVPGRNAFADPCCRVAQGSATPALATARNWGLVDAVQCWAAGTVSAGTITQDTAYTVAGAATAYSCKIAGATITGTGKVSFRRFVESRDAIAFKNGYGLFGVLVRHDASSAINAFLTVNSATAQDNFATVSNIATGAAVAVSSNTDTLVTVAIPNMGPNTGNGIEVILEMDCGAVTTKDFWATDWQACIKTLTQKVAVPKFEEDLYATYRYFVSSYEYGTAPGTATNNGMSESSYGGGIANSGIAFIVRLIIKMLSTPGTVNIYSPSTGASGKVQDQTLSADKAVTTAADKSTIQVSNNSGGTIAAGDRLRYHYTADARP